MGFDWSCESLFSPPKKKTKEIFLKNEVFPVTFSNAEMKYQNEMLNYDINLKYSLIPLNISLNVVI